MRGRLGDEATDCSTGRWRCARTSSWGDRGHRRHGGVLLRASRGGVGVRADAGAADPLYLQATTACLSAIIVMQIVNVFLCRSTSRSLWSVGLRGNRLILWGVVLEVVLILVIDYTSVGERDLQYRAHLGAVWLFMMPFAIGLVALEELRKWYRRAVRRR